MHYEGRLEDACNQIFKITSRRYRDLAHDGKVPPVKRGIIDVLKASASLIEYYRKFASSQVSLSLADERTRWTKIRADREEIKKEKDNGNLVSKNDVENWLRAHIEETKMAFLGLPRRMGPVLAPIADEKEIEYLLSEEIYKNLEQMSKPLNAEKQSRRKDTRKSKAMVAAT